MVLFFYGGECAAGKTADAGDMSNRGGDTTGAEDAPAQLCVERARYFISRISRVEAGGRQSKACDLSFCV